MDGLALVFAGQGSQESGMGRALAERSAAAMEIWKEAERRSGLPLREICWSEEAGDAMQDTRVLQPALTVVHLAAWQEYSRCCRPACAAGHSLGEYAALAAAGVLSPGEVLELVSLRGRLMAEADPEGAGTMAAVVKLSRETVEALVAAAVAATGKAVRIANANTPAQFVVSGEREAVEEVCREAKASRGRAIALAVSGAFHSPMMAEAAKELVPALQRASWQDARFPVYCNVDGAPRRAGSALCAALTVQMTSSVCWTTTIQHQYADGVRRWVEFGPRPVLAKMTGPCVAAMQGSEAIRSLHVSDPEAQTWLC